MIDTKCLFKVGDKVTEDHDYNPASGEVVSIRPYANGTLEPWKITVKLDNGRVYEYDACRLIWTEGA